MTRTRVLLRETQVVGILSDFCRYSVHHATGNVSPPLAPGTGQEHPTSRRRRASGLHRCLRPVPHRPRDIRNIPDKPFCNFSSAATQSNRGFSSVSTRDPPLTLGLTGRSKMSTPVTRSLSSCYTGPRASLLRRLSPNLGSGQTEVSKAPDPKKDVRKERAVPYLEGITTCSRL